MANLLKTNREEGFLGSFVTLLVVVGYFVGNEYVSVVFEAFIFAWAINERILAFVCCGGKAKARKSHEKLNHFEGFLVNAEWLSECRMTDLTTHEASVFSETKLNWMLFCFPLEAISNFFWIPKFFFFLYWKFPIERKKKNSFPSLLYNNWWKSH